MASGENKQNPEQNQARRLQNLADRREAMFARYGWLVDVVGYGVCEACGEGNTGQYFDIHTHGLPETFGHPDLQIIGFIEPETAHPIFCAMVQMISKGGAFHPGVAYHDVFSGDQPLRMIWVKQSDRPLLRLLLPLNVVESTSYGKGRHE